MNFIFIFFYQKYEKLVYLKTQNSPRDNGKQLTDSVVTIPMSIAWRVSEILCVIICHRESAKYLYSCYIFTKWILNFVLIWSFTQHKLFNTEGFFAFEFFPFIRLIYKAIKDPLVVIKINPFSNIIGCTCLWSDS